MRGAVSVMLSVATIGGALACARPNPALAPGRELGDAVVCDTDCAAAWQRAQLWLVKYSYFKIQTANDVVIQTYTSVNGDPNPDFTITRESLADGKYRIQARAHCASLFGCIPNADDRRGALLYYIKTGSDLIASSR